MFGLFTKKDLASDLELELAEERRTLEAWTIEPDDARWAAHMKAKERVAKAQALADAAAAKVERDAVAQREHDLAEAARLRRESDPALLTAELARFADVLVDFAVGPAQGALAGMISVLERQRELVRRAAALERKHGVEPARVVFLEIGNTRGVTSRRLAKAFAEHRARGKELRELAAWFHVAHGEV